MELIKREYHLDARGWLCEVARSSVVGEIAQVYVTKCHPGVVKGWHRHQRQTDRLFCVSGMARIVTARVVSAEQEQFHVTNFPVFEEVVVGPPSQGLVVIPPGLWHAFTPAGPDACVIINCPDREYDGTDEERMALDEMPYDWWGVSR